MIFWLNGNYLTDEKSIAVTDRGFTLGDGLFETLYIENGRAAFLADHLDRLKTGAAALKLPAAVPEDMPQIIKRLARENELNNAIAALRITVTRGGSPRGLLFPEKDDARPTVLVSMAPFSSNTSGNPKLLAVSSHVRSEKSLTSRVKAIGYLDQIMAHNEVAALGADEAIMLNSAGRVACASTANVFVISQKGAIATPPVGEGALPGIVRGLLLKSTDDVGVEITERPVDVEDLKGGVPFLTNSLIGLCRAKLNKEKTQYRRPQEIFNHLNSWYQARLRDAVA